MQFPAEYIRTVRFFCIHPGYSYSTSLEIKGYRREKPLKTENITSVGIGELRNTHCCHLAVVVVYIKLERVVQKTKRKGILFRFVLMPARSNVRSMRYCMNAASYSFNCLLHPMQKSIPRRHVRLFRARPFFILWASSAVHSNMYVL